jgi:UDP-2,4-diacetamido-2,4,6-trideoxy-beta-L-altropyranose hydrolase
MRVVFRVDASLKIGTGHVMRCLTLAEELKQQGSEVEFICREHEGNLIGRIARQGFKVHKLAQCTDITDSKESLKDNSIIEKAVLYGKQWLGSTQQQDAEQCESILETIKPDWLIVDHYALDHNWQAQLQGLYKKLMVIDDLADRKHLCDLLLDQTYGREKSDYANFVPEHCKMLLGSHYALLRPEFAQWREYSLKRRANPELKKILITMGGVDPDNITGKVLKALKGCKLPEEIEITVVMGEIAPNIEAVQKQAKEMLYKTQIKTNVNNMAELMANADLAIGAAGATTWERCCLGLPSIVMGLADNQKDILFALANKNIIVTIDKERVGEGIKVIDTLSEKSLVMLSKNAIKVVDGASINKVTESINLGAY